MISDATPTSTLISIYQKKSKDSTAANIVDGKEAMNYHYRQILSLADNWVNERTKYGNSKENQRSYLLPPDYLYMKQVRFKSGNDWHPLTEVKTMDEWHYLTNSNRYVTIPDFYFVFNEQGNMYIELDGIPDADGSQNIEIVYEGFQNRLVFPDDVSSPGTVAINNGESTITGSSTTFASSYVGRFIRPTDAKHWYEIKTYTSTTVMVLVNYFQETSITGKGYLIAEIPRLPPGFGKTPLWGALMDYWQLENKNNYAMYKQLYDQDVALIRAKYQKKTKGSVVPGAPVGRRHPRSPINYPNSLLSRL